MGGIIELNPIRWSGRLRDLARTEVPPTLDRWTRENHEINLRFQSALSAKYNFEKIRDSYMYEESMTMKRDREMDDRDEQLELRRRSIDVALEPLVSVIESWRENTKLTPNEAEEFDRAVERFLEVGRLTSKRYPLDTMISGTAIDILGRISSICLFHGGCEALEKAVGTYIDTIDAISTHELRQSGVL